MAKDASDIVVRYDDASHRYWLKGGGLGSFTEVPSVTTILSTMAAKDALGWWGMRVGMAGVVELMRTVSWAQIANANEPAHIIDPALLPEGERHFTAADYKRLKPRSFVEKAICDMKRTVNHLQDEAADRGTDIHAALEALALDEMPDVNRFPAEQRGWVAGLMAWWLEQEPRFLLNEVIVGSAEHRFAGRFDTIVQYPDGRVVLTDLKTSKGVYKSHLRQLALYEAGFDEMNLWGQLGDAHGLAERDPFSSFDGLEVLHVTRDGRYGLVPSKYRREHVLPTVAAYHADREGWLLHKDIAGLHEEVR